MTTIIKTEVMDSFSESITEKRDELIQEKEVLDYKLRRLEKKHVDDTLISTQADVSDIKDAISDIQNSLNIAWKRVHKIEEKIKSALSY